MDSLAKILGRNSSIDKEFPRISTEILLLWGSPECLICIENLLGYTHTEQRPMRQGFSMPIINELTELLTEHLRAFPFMHSEYTNLLDDPWNWK